MGLAGKLVYPLRIWAETLSRAAIPPATRTQRHRLFRALEVLRNRLPVTTLERIIGDIGDEVTVTVRALQCREHNCSNSELFALAAITRMIEPARALEIGTYDGRSTLAIASNTPGEVYTMNLPPDYFDAHPDERALVDVQLSVKVRSGGRIAGAETARVHQVFANSREYDFSQLGPIQLAFIDGAHDEVTVKSDTERVLSILDRDNSAILWDDATMYGVGRYLPTLDLPVYLIRDTDLAILRFRNGEPVRFE